MQQISAIQRAKKAMEKKEKELLSLLKKNDLENFKDNLLCKAYITPKNVRTHQVIFFVDIEYSGENKEINVMSSLKSTDTIDKLSTNYI